MRKNVGKSLLLVLIMALTVACFPLMASADESVTDSPAAPSDSSGSVYSGVMTRRIAGPDRYGTSFAAADVIHEINGQHPNIVIASGQNFPDALSGGYLAKVMDAPLILTNPAQESKIISYIQSKLAPGGTVYLLGGNFAVRDSFEKTLADVGTSGAGFSVRRLWGLQRYATNLSILENSLHYLRQNNMPMPKSLLVASGKGFADSLSASAVGLPLLLVDKTLSNDQIAWLATCGIKNFEIIGGEAAVTKAVEDELRKLGSVKRIAGSNRWETSKAVASYFRPDAETVTLASGLNFPDGLSGAPVAMLYESPIVLVSNSAYTHAQEFVTNKGIDRAVIIGGSFAINDTTVSKIMGTYVDPAALNPIGGDNQGGGSRDNTGGNASGDTISGGGTVSGGGYPIPEADSNGQSYVLNIKTGKFHFTHCRKLPTDNRYDIVTTREKIIAAGYDPCGICRP